MLKKQNLSIIGRMIILESVILLIPLLVIPFYIDEYTYGIKFILPALISGALGLFLGYRIKKDLSSSEIVVFIWLYGSVLASFPFLLLGNLTVVQSFFEAVSGFTTTGLSVLDVSKLPHIFLFYRGFLQYVGGLGFVLMILLFIQEKDSISLYQAEGHPDRIMPSIGKTAKVIVKMYGFFLIMGCILYTTFGMPIFDSLVHTMCALSTGGFSNKMDSIGYYKSIPIEWITILLMFVGTTNFSFLLLLFKGRIREFFKSSEIRFLFLLVIIFIPVLSLIFINMDLGVLESIERSFFNIFSSLSTTGYGTSDFKSWPETGLFILTILMIIGGGIGSTAGGIKLGRICRILENTNLNIKKKLLPERTIRLGYYNRGNNKEVLDKNEVEDDFTYFHTYLLIFIVGTLSLSYFSKSPIIYGAFEFASSLGTVGLSIGITNMESPSIVLIIEIIGMILGRLEIFVLLKAFAKWIFPQRKYI